MPTLTTRDVFQSALRSTQKDLRGMFEDMSHELTALIVSYAGEDGKIAPDQLDELQRDSRAIIEKYFITRRRVSFAEKETESERLRELISTAQKQLKRASKREAFELRNRITLLGKRLALLERRGEVIETITADGAGASPYARILARRITGVIGGVLRKHAEYIRSVLERA